VVKRLVEEPAGSPWEVVAAVVVNGLVAAIALSSLRGSPCSRAAQL
jgi:hypothetical protein